MYSIFEARTRLLKSLRSVKKLASQLVVDTVEASHFDFLLRTKLPPLVDFNYNVYNLMRLNITL